MLASAWYAMSAAAVVAAATSAASLAVARATSHPRAASSGRLPATTSAMSQAMYSPTARPPRAVAE